MIDYSGLNYYNSNGILKNVDIELNKKGPRTAALVVGFTDDCDYNITALGTTESAQTTINAIIASLTDGGKIFLREGIYKCTNNITLNKNNITIEGVGDATIFQSDYTLNITGDYCNIKNCTFIASGSRNVAAIKIVNKIGYVTIENNIFRNCYYGVQSSGTSTNLSQYITVTNNTFYDSRYNGIYLYSSSYFTGVVVSFNKIFRVAATSGGMGGEGISVNYAYGALVTNNYCEGTSTGPGISINNCLGGSLSNNIINKCYYGLSNLSKNFIVSNNNIRDCTNGLMLLTQGDFCVITGNHITQASSNSGYYGIGNSGNHCSITGNVIQLATENVQGGLMSSGQRCVISGNIVHTTTATSIGLKISGAYSTVIGNRVIGSSISITGTNSIDANNSTL